MDKKPSKKAIIAAMDHYFSEHNGVETFKQLEDCSFDLPDGVCATEDYEDHYAGSLYLKVRDLAEAFDNFIK